MYASTLSKGAPTNAARTQRPVPSPPPAPTGRYAADTVAVTSYLTCTMRYFAQLPPPGERTDGRQREAAAVHHDANTLRRCFLSLHAERAYDELTDGRTRPLRLDELVGLAAERFPGLVPSSAQLADEAQHMQRDKEGWEIAVGIFLQAVLHVPTAGDHLLRSMLRPTPRACAALHGYQLTGRADLGLATVVRNEGVARLELCNPAFLNAEDEAAVEALETGTDLVLLDPASHVGVLRGAPQTHPSYAGSRVFCAGINLTHLYGGDISLLGFLLRREAGYIAKFVRGLCLDDTARDGWWPDADKPWVGAVDSFAIGGGMQILPTMDRVVADDDSWFSLPAMEEGLVPGAANMRLLHQVGARLSRRLIFWGRKLHATDPEASLFIDETVAADSMDIAVRKAAERLDNPAVGANRRMLNLAGEPLDHFRRYLAQYAYEQACRLHSPSLINALERTWINRDRDPDPSASAGDPL
ncbi:enoyl-CoA hydratase/isomerase family protein [Streptomyces iconiensis]|uniref:Enoyl-CoA hydratase/isomerase family protein n=1 Tax=Streptomyces iconiensis TaxID=1384038 RepID=A0ABT7A8Y2_9ACTN|nr:enoyl-CoA hydratase/isomerase family protein [Streptomyces iconiensis]MDJ1137454.1 enoyl-CoA hydratase/isomerase family protein [Streptomyces iconiensis]